MGSPSARVLMERQTLASFLPLKIGGNHPHLRSLFSLGLAHLLRSFENESIIQFL
uniref:Uncharacterized protein n=1 Tax=Helianthus annuus TaxID=4232 RepID=A0A251U8M5_HELAN